MKQIIILIAAILSFNINVEGKTILNETINTVEQSSEWEFVGMTTIYSFRYDSGRWINSSKYLHELWVMVIGDQVFYKVKQPGTQDKLSEYFVMKNPNYGKPDKEGADYTHYVDGDGNRFYLNI